MKHFFIVLLLSTITFYSASAQGISYFNFEQSKYPRKNNPAGNIHIFQEQLQTSIKKVYAASVRVITHERLTPTGGVSASGVCVCKDGIIMTAGHLTVPGGKYNIVFPDGTEAKATGLGKIGMLDAGLLKINEEGEFSFVNLGYSSTLVIGEPCFSLAYPGSFSDKMVARFGKVVGKNVGQFGSLQTTCLMEPGDSGGPVFDMDGNVIGIRSYIGMPLKENFEVPVSYYRKYWNVLQKPVNYRQIPEADPLVFKNGKTGYSGLLWPAIEKLIQEKEAVLDDYTVLVKSSDNHIAKTIVGTMINPEGLVTDKKLLKGSLIVSKSSEVGKEPEVMWNNKTYSARIIYRDRNRDLVLLQTNIKTKSALRVSNMVSGTLGTKQLGKILISPLPLDNGEISILGTAPFSIPAVYNTGFLGVKLERKDGKNTITHVQPNTAASKAMLKKGDVILWINKTQVGSPSDFINELKGKKPLEGITLVRWRDGKTDTLHILLDSRPFKGYGHISEQFTDGRSERRDGFEAVFIHDAKLKPSECGGPIFGLNNHFIGINMARYSRTSSIGMPANEVMEFLKQALAE